VLKYVDKYIRFGIGYINSEMINTDKI